MSFEDRARRSSGGPVGRTFRSGGLLLLLALVAGVPGKLEAQPVEGILTVPIDVMAVYTPQARDAAGGVAAIEATIQAAVDNANTAFIDSNMAARFTLVHTSLADYNDSGSSAADLDWVSSNAGVAELRDLHGADMVALIPENLSGSCGRGYVMRNPGPGFEDSAFQVTDRGCAVGNLTYAHEHGHNMGFEHNRENGPEPGVASFPWSFGRYVNGSYRTVMSYSSPCTSGCTRVPHFSNPDILHNGVATGVEDTADNARSGEVTAPIVAAFRLGPIALFSDGFESGNTGAWNTTVGSSLHPGPIAGAVTAAPATGSVDLFHSLELVESPAAEVRSAWRAAISAAQLAAEPAALRLAFADGGAYVAERTSVERRGPADLAWRGRLAGTGQRVVLTVKGGLVAGRLETPDGVYEIQPAAGGGHRLLMLDLDAFAPCSVGVDSL